MRGALDDYIFMSLVLFTISTTWFNAVLIIITQFYHAIHDQISCSLNHRYYKQCRAGNLANADKWEIAFAILVSIQVFHVFENTIH